MGHQTTLSCLINLIYPPFSPADIPRNLSSSLTHPQSRGLPLAPTSLVSSPLPTIIFALHTLSTSPISSPEQNPKTVHFSQSILCLWNDLSANIKSITSIGQFKFQLNRLNLFSSVFILPHSLLYNNLLILLLILVLAIRAFCHLQ